MIDGDRDLSDWLKAHGKVSIAGVNAKPGAEAGFRTPWNLAPFTHAFNFVQMRQKRSGRRQHSAGSDFLGGVTDSGI